MIIFDYKLKVSSIFLYGNERMAREINNETLQSLRVIWRDSNKQNKEVGGIIDICGKPKIHAMGDAHAVAYDCTRKICFHTHPTQAVQGTITIADILTPPSGADYIAVLLTRKNLGEIEYVASECGVWQAECNSCTNYVEDKDIVELYYQILKYNFKNFVQPFNENMTKDELVGTYLAYANYINPEPLLKQFQEEPGYISFVNDQLTRTYHKYDLTVEMFQKNAMKLIGKQLFTVSFWEY
jgi:hypothetical protein